MAITVLPIFQSPLSDIPADTSANKVTPTRWNQGHKIQMATARLLGRTTASAGDAEEISVGNGLALASGALAVDIATAANIRARTASKVLTADGISSAKAAVSLAYSATRSLVWTDAWFRTCTLTGNMTISNPSSVEAGDTIVLRLVGDGATARTVSWGTNFKGNLPTETVLSTRALLCTLYASTATEIVVSYSVIE